MALTPSGGIPHAVYTAAVAGTPGTPWSLTAGSAVCKIGRHDGDNFLDSGQTAAVLNDYTSSTARDIAGNVVVPIGVDATGRYRVIGEPC